MASQSSMSRRTFLRSSALVLLAGTAAACGATPTATPMPTPTKAPVPPTATSQPAAAPTALPPAAAPTATSAPKPIATVPSSQTKAEVYLLLDAAYQPYLDKFAAPFKAKYPNVTINFEPVGEGMGEKQLVQMVAGTAPDVMLGGQPVLPMWAEKNQLVDLKPLIDRDLTKAQVDDFPAWAWKQNQYAGTGMQVGFPRPPWIYEYFYKQGCSRPGWYQLPEVGMDPQ